MSLLTLENIFKEYRNKIVLNGVSLRVERGERLSLIGPNGSGKSTLIKIALGMEPCDRGSVVVARNIKIGYISQDMSWISEDDNGLDKLAIHHEKIYSLESKLRQLETQMAMGPGQFRPDEYDKLLKVYSKTVQEYEALDGYSIESKIKATLLGLGLSANALSIPLSCLSGGERMRVSIAKLLLEEPDLLILDEPTNHLDINGTEWLEGLLKKFDGGALIISHDRFFLDQISTRVAELENGVLTERSGNYTSFVRQKNVMREFAMREQFRLKQEIKSQNLLIQELKSRGKVKAYKSRIKAKAKLTEELESGVSRFKEQEHLKRRNSFKLSLGTAKHISKEIAKAEGLCKRFDKKVLFDNASFLIRGRERVGIIGSNGCGKSTLLNILMGKDTDFQGTAKLGGWVKYAFLGQEIYFNNPDHTIREEILSRAEMLDREVLDYLSRYQFYGDDINKVINVLSGGEKVRLYFACMMLQKQDCFIMDEPTNHLDIDARNALEQALKAFNGSVVAVSHDRYFLTHCVNRILEISDGKIVSYEGNYERYRQLKNSVVSEKSGIISKSASIRERKNSKKVENKPAQSERDIAEAAIMDIESRLKEMENTFDENTPLATYQEYDRLMKEKEQLYELWENLCE